MCRTLRLCHSIHNQFPLQRARRPGPDVRCSNITRLGVVLAQVTLFIVHQLFVLKDWPSRIVTTKDMPFHSPLDGLVLLQGLASLLSCTSTACVCLPNMELAMGLDRSEVQEEHQHRAGLALHCGHEAGSLSSASAKVVESPKEEQKGRPNLLTTEIP